MHNYVIRREECMGRVIVFGQKPGLVLTPTDTGLFASVGSFRTALRAAGASQADGGRGFREGTKERRFAAQDLRVAMRDIAEIAKGLDEEGLDLGAAERFRMPKNGCAYSILTATAQGFADAAEPRAALFIARGLAATFVEDLEALIALVDSSADARETGRGAQVGGTASLESLADEGMKKVRQLRSIMRVKLRDDAALLAEWETAARVHRASSSTTATPPPESGESGSGTTPPAGS